MSEQHACFAGFAPALCPPQDVDLLAVVEGVIVEGVIVEGEHESVELVSNQERSL